MSYVEVNYQMKIVLLRHGKPDIPRLANMNGVEFVKWINSYDLAALDEKCSPAEDALLIAQSCSAVICSTLRRSIESAEMLGVSDKVEASSEFVEANLPNFGVMSLRLPARVWLVVFRLSWFIGYSPNSESYLQVKERAKNCASQLINIAQDKESVMFVGHGILNRLISKELIRRKWRGPARSKSDYWQFSIYENGKL